MSSQTPFIDKGNEVMWSEVRWQITSALQSALIHSESAVFNATLPKNIIICAMSHICGGLL